MRASRLYEFLGIICLLCVLGVLSFGILHDPAVLGTLSNMTATTSSQGISSENEVVAQNYKFGISLGDTLFSMTNGQINQEFADIASLGLGWVRFDMAWDDIEPNASNMYQWDQIDAIVADANAYHLKLLPVLAYTPVWARPSDCMGSDKCAPQDPGQFAVFAQAAVMRYTSQGVYAWEIWNEPNTAYFWQPQPDPQSYVLLLKDAYAAIKAQDPEAVVITGGLSPSSNSGGVISPTNFLAALYQDGGDGYFDAVGMHPYTYPYLPTLNRATSAWTQMASTSISMRSIMTSYGDAGKAIWITEYGAPTGGPGTVTSNGTSYGSSADHVTEGLQSQMLTEAMTSAESLSWTGPLFIYSYKDLGNDPSTVENFFGIINYDGTMKPSYTAIKELLSAHN
jgi:hypothetical protein